MLAIRAVTVDVHGTLIAPSPDIGTQYAGEAAAHGVQIDAARLNEVFPGAFRAVYREWPVPYGRDQDDARAYWFQVIRDSFAAAGVPDLPDDLPEALFVRFGRAAHWRILPGARAALSRVRAAGLPLFLCTNFDERVRPILVGHSLTDHDGLYISAAIGAAKPDPAMLQAACADAGVSTAALLHIGDSEREDGGAAQACGARWLPVARDGSGIDGGELDRILQEEAA